MPRLDCFHFYRRCKFHASSRYGYEVNDTHRRQDTRIDPSPNSRGTSLAIQRTTSPEIPSLNSTNLNHLFRQTAQLMKHQSLCEGRKTSPMARNIPYLVTSSRRTAKAVQTVSSRRTHYDLLFRETGTAPRRTFNATAATRTLPWKRSRPARLTPCQGNRWYAKMQVFPRRVVVVHTQ